MSEQTKTSKDRNDPLLQPFQIKHLRLKNRIISTSHEPAYAEDAKPKLRYQLYHEEKAKGGIALTMFGGSANVAPDSPAVFGNLYIGDDDIIPYFQALAQRVHKYGTALMCQITHMGRRTFWNAGHWLPTLAPSCGYLYHRRRFAGPRISTALFLRLLFRTRLLRG